MFYPLSFTLYTSQPPAPTNWHTPPLEFLPRFQYSLKVSVISVENILERTCGELPRPPFLRWAAVLFTLFVLTLQISIAASQALLAGAGVLYVIHLLQARPRVLFLPVKLPLALFCVLSSGFDFLGGEPHSGVVCGQKTCVVSHLAAGDKLGGQRGALAPPLAGTVSCILRDKPCWHRAIRHPIPRRAGASSRRALPLPDVNAHPWVYGTLDALWWTADVGFRLSAGISAALQRSKFETRNSKLGS